MRINWRVRCENNYGPFFFEIEIKYDSKRKFHAENDGNIGFLWKQQ